MTWACRRYNGSGYSERDRMKSLLVTVTAVLLLSACSPVGSPTQSTPTPAPTPTPTATPAPTKINGANWIADAIVLSSTGGGCGWGIVAGETRSGVLWKITQTGSAVTLDEDMPNYPTDDILYLGSLSGIQFTAAEVQTGDGVCHFRGGDLSGSFSDDGLHFDALETLRWGSTDHDVIVQRHWTGSRL